MSVQNGERLATKQDLADMYSGILPYLGGMPEVLANKFSKGDLYSTDEKMIGKWIDGKPLYERVFVDSFHTTNNYNNYRTIDVSAINMEYVKLVEYSLISGNDHFYNGGSSTTGFYIHDFVVTNGSLRYWIKEVDYNRDCTIYIILQYTKTTDSANSFNIGESTDYSTDEKIIGTWLNGEPLYQKTISCGALPNKTLKNVAHGISNLNKVVNLYGMAYNNSYWSSLPKVHDKDINIQCAIYENSTNIMIEGRETDFSGFTESYITIQYTKSNS